MSRTPANAGRGSRRRGLRGGRGRRGSASRRAARRRPSPRSAGRGHRAGFSDRRSPRRRQRACSRSRRHTRADRACASEGAPRGAPRRRHGLRARRAAARRDARGTDLHDEVDTAPMSIPSSSEDVATMDRSSPRFSCSSTSPGLAALSEPWWGCGFLASDVVDGRRGAPTGAGCSRRHRPMRDERLHDAPVDAWPGLRSSDQGSTPSTSCFCEPASTMVTGRGAPRSKPLSRRPTSSKRGAASRWRPRAGGPSVHAFPGAASGPPSR